MARPACLPASLALLLAVAVHPGVARGDTPAGGGLKRDDLLAPPTHPKPNAVEWDPTWPRFRAAELWATGIFAAVALGSLAIPDGGGRWTTVNGFDDSVRSALRFKTAENRERAQDASDIMLTLSFNYLLFDSAVVTWWAHGRGSVALQIALIDIEAVALTTAITSLAKGVSARERPFRTDCSGPESRQERDCQGQNRYQSFFSGHTSTAFTAAGLTCQHHAHLPLYGGGAPDTLACISSFALAGATGAMRIMSDRHWATDVIGGAVIGTASGMAVPYLLHYRGGAPAPTEGEKGGVKIGVVPAPMGAAVVGVF